MNCTCPECKNLIDLSRYQSLSVKHVVECNHCGITLEVTGIDNNIVNTIIVDEGK